jgi:hypothetical protein
MAITVVRTKSARENYLGHESQLYSEVNYNTPGVATGFLIGKIPAFSVVKNVTVSVESTFNAATTNVLTVGTSTTATEWVDATVLSSGATVDTYATDIGYALTTSDLSVYAKYTQSGTAASAGKAHVWVEYAQKK